MTATPQTRLKALFEAMTPDQRDQFMREALVATAKADKQQSAAVPEMSFPEFKQRFWRGYQPTVFDPALDALLQSAADYILSEGEHGISRIMVNLPPRHGKTARISRLFPAWMLGRLPDLEIISTSYGASLAYKNSRAVRNLINSQAYREAFPATRLVTNRVDQWETSEGGGLLAAGVGGAIVGHGARLIIIDDPTKSRAEAESRTWQERLREWYGGDLYTRLTEPGAVIIVMATRWSEADLPGYLLSGDDETGDEWHTLTLPAIADAADPLGRAEGEALWPERYPVEKLDKIRSVIGSYEWSAQYQQAPISREDALFDCGLIEIIDEAPPLKTVCRAWDLAITTKKRSDFTVGLKLGMAQDERLIVLDVYRRQTTPTQLTEAIVIHAMLDGKECPTRLEGEKTGIVELDFLLNDERLRGYTLDAQPPKGDKYTRATPVSTRVNAGKLAIVKGQWNRAFLDELATFPAGQHDDQVDALSLAYNKLAAPRRHYISPDPSDPDFLELLQARYPDSWQERAAAWEKQ